MITCQINSQSLVTVYDEVVSDSVEYLIASFTFSDDWDGYSRTVIFSNDSNNKVLIVTLTDGDSLYLGNNRCYVPHEVIESPGFSISVFGIKDKSVITTDKKNIVVRESGYKRGEIPEEPTPTDVERIIGIATSAKNVADSVRQDADEGKFNGKDGAPGEKGDKGDKGDPAETDEHYDPTSDNAQSGKAVAEAVLLKLDKRTKEELDDLTNIVQEQLYVCTFSGELKNCTITNKETNEVFQGYLYKYNGNNSYTQINTMPLPEIPESIQVTGEWLDDEHSAEDHGDKIYQCITTEYGFIQGYFYLSVNRPGTSEYYWQQLNVQPQTLIDIENGEGDYSIQQKTDTENQPLALGKWSMAEGRGQNFIGDIISIPITSDIFALHVTNANEVTNNIFYYRPTTSGLAPNKSYSMSLVWEDTGRAFSYGRSGTFCIYAYNGSSWVPITSTNYTTSFKISSMPLQNNVTYYNITFKTADVGELREIVFAFGALSSKSVGFSTGMWKLYRLDDGVWTDISNRCPDFSTVKFRDASDNAMNNWFTNWSATDRGRIWRRSSRDYLSNKTEYPSEIWYSRNNIVVGGINADKIRENAVIWFPRYPNISVTQGAYFYVKTASKSYPALLELDDYERKIKDSDGNEIRTQRICDSDRGSQVLVYMGAAISSDSHIEGNFNNAVWLNSDTRINEVDVRRQHVEGSRNLATGYAATVSGEYNKATGNHTDVGGEHNEAHYAYQTVRGRYNNNKEGNLFEIGNGNKNTRQNAFEVHSNGTAKVQVQGSTNDSVAQKGYVDSAIAEAVTALTDTIAPTSTTIGYVGQFYINIKTSTVYQCIAKTEQGTIPETYTYTWHALTFTPTMKTGTTVPTTSTVADYIGQLYEVTTANGILYFACVSINNGTYTWKRIYLETSTEGVVIGNSRTELIGTINIGQAKSVSSGQSGRFSICMGYANSCRGNYGVAIGGSVGEGAENAIQLGSGTNSTPNTMNVAFRNGGNYRVLEADGTIPPERITSKNWTDSQRRAILASLGCTIDENGYVRFQQ